MPRPVRPARGPRTVSLQELSEMSNIPNEPESETVEISQPGHTHETPEAPTPAFGSQSQTARRAAARAEATAATSPETLTEDTDFTVTDSSGESVTFNVPAGSRVRQHAHVPRGIGVCVLCHLLQAHETSNRPPRERVLDQDETFAFQIPNPEFVADSVPVVGADPVPEYLDVSVTIPAGSKEKLIRSDGAAHEHADMPRTPSCAYCMALFEAVRANRPARERPAFLSAPASEPRECRCLCGGMTRGGRYLPGHDARLAGRVKRFQEFLEDNRDELTADTKQLSEFPEFDKMPADIIEHAQSPNSTCSCCGVPLLEPHESGMGPRCRAGLCNCNPDAEAEATESTDEAQESEEEDPGEDAENEPAE